MPGDVAHAPTLDPRHDVRVRDPASRDQDPRPWRRGRFEERVRREWNPVTSADLAAAAGGDRYDLQALAERIRARVGGDVGPILARLREFERIEAEGAPPAPDGLTRPGHGV